MTRWYILGAVCAFVGISSYKVSKSLTAATIELSLPELKAKTDAEIKTLTDIGKKA